MIAKIRKTIYSLWHFPFEFIQRKYQLYLLLKKSRELESELDRIESLPLYFEADFDDKKKFLEVLETGAQLITKLMIHSKQPIASQKSILKYKLLALRYRLEDVHSGIDPVSVQQSLVNLLKKIVLDWKRNHPFESGDEGISERDLLEIIVTSKYPEFVHLLIEDKSIRNQFMLWTLRDGNSAQIFIEYPALQKKIVACNLSGRIGRKDKSHLSITKIDTRLNEKIVKEKVVTLPFEGIKKNILNENCIIIFRGNLQLSIREIFQIFKNKNFEVGDLEYLEHGITNWNVHKWAYWSDIEKKYICISLSHHQWWKQLPFFEVISQQQAFARYEKRLKGTEWCVSAAATRGSPTLNYENTHAFFEIAIPRGDGYYAIYNFGKFATKFPNNFLETLSIFCENLHATIAYPDENIFYSHRQQAYHSFVIDENQGLKLMNLIKEDMLKAKELNFVYQVESDNCAKWVHHHLEEILGKKNVPDMFKMHLLDTEPVGIVAILFKLMKKLPHWMQTSALTFCHLFLGATKKTWIFEGGRKVCKSLTRHEFWQTGVVYLPALLLFKKEQGLLREIVHSANRPLKIVENYCARHIPNRGRIDPSIKINPLLVLFSLLEGLKRRYRKRRNPLLN